MKLFDFKEAKRKLKKRPSIFWASIFPQKKQKKKIKAPERKFYKRNTAKWAVIGTYILYFLISNILRIVRAASESDGGGGAAAAGAAVAGAGAAAGMLFVTPAAPVVGASSLSVLYTSLIAVLANIPFYGWIAIAVIIILMALFGACDNCESCTSCSSCGADDDNDNPENTPQTCAALATFKGMQGGGICKQSCTAGEANIGTTPDCGAACCAKAKASGDNTKTENKAPVISNTGSIEIDEDSDPFTIQLSAADEDKELKWSASRGKSSLIKVSLTGSAAAFTLQKNKYGSASVVFTATDSGGLSSSATIEITINPVNDPPEIISTALTAATQGSKYSYLVDAKDPDGDTLTYALSAAPDGMSIGPDGTITWTPAQSQVGSNAVTVIVKDPSGERAVQSFAVEVTDANDNPEITSTALTTAIQNLQYSYTITATDADGDTPAYSLMTKPAGMSIDSNSGLITWTPTQQQVGSSSATARASDGKGGSAEQSWTITVADINDPPQITSSPTILATVGSPYSYDVDAIDPDGDAISYSLAISPAGMTISQSGLIEWTPLSGQTGSSTVRAVASDGSASSYQEFIVIVS